MQSMESVVNLTVKANKQNLIERVSNGFSWKVFLKPIAHDKTKFVMKGLNKRMTKKLNVYIKNRLITIEIRKQNDD